jgi:hypothetical protein
VTGPARHRPVGEAVLRAIDVPAAIDLEPSALEAQKIADDVMTVRPEPCIESAISETRGEGRCDPSKPPVQAETGVRRAWPPALR